MTDKEKAATRRIAQDFGDLLAHAYKADIDLDTVMSCLFLGLRVEMRQSDWNDQEIRDCFVDCFNAVMKYPAK